ncbi:RNA polymerase sigma factor [Oxalicibacterium flavum]|uniref:RNA polymerase sigma factor n=1 Tax=Oxalicibacterium flavum TaxID=179467 RepID=A0A8J2UMS9_9BURK|nr:sigma-70 family RNA polymerase sigma factor [Oxalicibacterium flavum]GGB99360.1 RNA polymerase sigma factor [Oxalicibacterium flavum]
MSSADSPAHQQLATLYSDHHGWLQSWLRGKLGNAGDAADLAHDTFLRVLVARNAAAIQQPREYLATIARGLVTDRFRRQAIERAWLETLAAQPEPQAVSPETRAIVLETLVAIDRMLDDMGTRAREIFMLAQFEGLTYAQIGARLGISITTVKKHLVRALTHCLILSAE